MKIMGKRADGVLIVDIGSKTAYAVDLSSNRYAYIGDVDCKAVKRTVLTPIARADDLSNIRLAAERVLERGQKVDLEFVPFQKKDEAEKRTCDADTTLEDDEECVDGYIEKKKKDNPFADGGKPF